MPLKLKRQTTVDEQFFSEKKRHEKRNIMINIDDEEIESPRKLNSTMNQGHLSHNINNSFDQDNVSCSTD